MRKSAKTSFVSFAVTSFSMSEVMLSPLITLTESFFMFEAGLETSMLCWEFTFKPFLSSWLVGISSDWRFECYDKGMPEKLLTDSAAVGGCTCESGSFMSGSDKDLLTSFSSVFTTGGRVWPSTGASALLDVVLRSRSGWRSISLLDSLEGKVRGRSFCLLVTSDCYSSYHFTRFCFANNLSWVVRKLCSQCRLKQQIYNQSSVHLVIRVKQVSVPSP